MRTPPARRRYWHIGMMKPERRLFQSNPRAVNAWHHVKVGGYHYATYAYMLGWAMRQL